MDVRLISDKLTPRGRVIEVDVTGADTSATPEIVEYIRKTWGASATADVFGDGEYPRDGVSTWMFTFVDDAIDDGLEPSAPAGPPTARSSERS
ncbi:hypothetical protein [uncultured Friedmanniella sp.]|uniref:hypothetical protein n=1 Tax=uncultured Friedmanniella sp. TaxID=335381 RepID=UPI0035CB1055